MHLMMQKIIILVTIIVLLLAANYAVWQNESIIEDGTIVLLELAPVDPRSMMQGDYMALRYKMPLQVFSQKETGIMEDGSMILNLDENHVASFSHFDSGVSLTANQVRFNYRIRNGMPKMASNAFFFQEGDAKLYQDAEYGIFRVNNHGNALLTGLADKNFNVLGNPVFK